MAGTSNVTGLESILFADNVSFDGTTRGGTVTLDGQLLIGSTVLPHIRVSTLTAGPGVSITNGSGTITIGLAGGGASIDSIGVQTGTSPVVPDGTGLITINGAVVAAGTNPVRTDGTGANTLAVEVQTSQALAAADATKIGLSNFDQTSFAVAATGFVTLSTTGAGKTITGNSGGALSPTANNWNILGAVAAAGTSPVTTSGAVSTLTVNVQTSQALIAADATKIGLSNFDSSSFAVAATGFVTLSTTGAGKTITGDTGGALSPTSNNWNILGGPGVTTTGSGSTLTINSVVYTDQGGSTSVLADSGSFATAAITLTLPAVPVQGELCEFVTTSAAALVVDAPGTQLIQIYSAASSAGGTATCTAVKGSSLVLRYRASDTTWYATSVNGIWITA